MSVENPTQRSDDKALAVFIQRFNDFADNTDKYRKNQDEAFKLIFDRLGAMKTTLDKLPCDGRKQLWDMKMDGISKDSRNQWIVIGALWTVIGTVSYAIFEAWIKLWSQGKG